MGKRPDMIRVSALHNSRSCPYLLKGVMEGDRIIEVSGEIVEHLRRCAYCFDREAYNAKKVAHFEWRKTT